MKPYIFISFFVILLCPFLGKSQVLYPPLNLQIAGIECSVYLTWDKPELPGGGTPPGLLGYYVYKEGSLLYYSPGQDTTWAYDISPQPCPSPTHTYWVTAKYDLAYYGNPGQYGESPSSDTVSISISCCCILPFTEHWDMGSFSYNDWTFEPAQGNWDIANTIGTPPPCAVFSGSPQMSDYSYTLVSKYLATNIANGCSDLFLDFDLKLDNIVASGTERLLVEYSKCGGVPDTILTIHNTAGTSWTHYNFSLNDARGVMTTVSFKAEGSNSADIQQWLVDNIIVSFTCRPPTNPALEIISNTINLSWEPPACDNGADPGMFITGYNVYRSDSIGMPPFTKITTTPVTGNSYTDVIADWNTPAVYKYYITDNQNDTSSNTFLCESVPSDTLTAVYTSSVPALDQGYLIYPNPTTGIFSVKVPEGAVSVEISYLNSRVIYSDDLIQNIGRQFNIDISGHPKGVYILTVKTKTGISRGKIVLF